MWKEVMELLFTVGSAQDVELNSVVDFCVVSAQWTFIMALEKDQELNFVGDEEVQCSCSDRIFKVCLPPVAYLPMLSSCFSWFIL